MGDKEKPEMVLKFKREDPEQFHCLVKMHLSFLLDMNTDECDCSFLFDHLYPGDHGTPKRKGSLLQSSKGTGITNKKGIMEGATLTMEGVCQIFQIIQFLDRTNNIEQIGLFRKTGNLQKQKVLKERLNRGVPMDLDQGEFSVHECASVLKTFLSELPEPLLTDRFFHAHCQVANKIIKYFAPNHSAESSDSNDTLSYDERLKLFKETDDFRRCVESLQLLFLLIPDANYNLLKDMLKFLRRITHHQEKNKMSASNLGTIFATHLMCPRKLSAESLQSNHQLYSSAVTFMIQQSDILFDIPEKVVQDVLAHRKRTSDKDLERLRLQQLEEKPSVQSPVVNTIFSFVDRQRTKEVTSESTTDTALAELYAQVQAMPESAQKRRLITKLNDANGCGTPKIKKPFISKTHHSNVTETLENFKSWITPRQKKTTSVVNTGGSLSKGAKKDKAIGRSGSYSLRQKKYTENKTLEEQTAPRSFKRCISEPQDGPTCNINQLPHLHVSQVGSNQLQATSVTQNDLDIDQCTFVAKHKVDATISENEFLPPPPNLQTNSIQKRAPPPIPPRVSSLKPKADTPQSPVVKFAKTEAIANPIAITPCVPGVASTPLHSDDCEEDIMMETKSIHSPKIDVRQKLNFLDASYEQDNSKNDTSVEDHCKAKDVDQKQGQEGPEANVSNVSEISTTSSNLWREGEQILKGEIDLSESMQLCLDGKDPIDDIEGSVNENNSLVSAESTANIIGSKGMIGIKNYLKIDASSHPKVGGSVTRDNLRKNIHNSNIESEEMPISPSYADRVSALLRTPPVLPVTGNKENKSLCNETNSCDTRSEPKLPRKRSLTEMIGHNPLSKERKPLGQRRCFETDL